MVQLLVILAVVPCFLAKSTIPANKLFVNTIKRWNIDVTDASDMSERWKRFSAAKESVDRSTRGVVLESLNLFSVLNDKEYEDIVVPLKRRSVNATLEDVMAEYHDAVNVQKRYEYIPEDEIVIPDTFTYWEKDVGLTSPSQAQGICGSCWSFPTVAALEAKYKEQTGEQVSFSQQFYVDCTFDGNGCVGGGISDGFKSTLMRQYLPTAADYQYQNGYQGCSIGDDIKSFKGNGLKKIWLTDILSVSINEKAFLYGLQVSPVAFGSLVSKGDFESYSGGEFEDVNCYNEAQPHAMLLVGYTETIMRVRNSYGLGWGDGGYANYIRGTITLGRCSFYKTAFKITTTVRREMEYEFCSNKKLVTYGDCKKSCEAMNTGSKSGWTLAIIPTKYHNTLVVDKINDLWPGVKNDDKFNYVWIGLTDMQKNGNFLWIDETFPVNYRNLTENTAKYGMLNKNTGNWAFKNSLSYKAKGMCSRAATCWDIGTVIENGVISFSNDILTEGTVAKASCNKGYSLIGDSSFSCVGGNWQTDLDQLSCT